MRFEFCGKLDCPDWVLAQLFRASRLDLERFGLICESVIATILADGDFDQSLFDRLDLDEELFDIDDARACFGVVNFVLTNAIIYRTSSKILSVELEQLGLPSEHCELLCDMMSAQSEAELRQHL